MRLRIILTLAGTLSTALTLLVVRLDRLPNTTKPLGQTITNGVDINPRPVTSAELPAVTRDRIIAAYGKLPLVFEPGATLNSSPMEFLAKGVGYTLFLKANETVLSVPGPLVKDVIPNTVHIKLIGANPAPLMEGLEQLPGKSNYLIGNNPNRWRTGVPHYRKIRYEDVYPGIDLIYYGNQQQIEHDFIVEPGADASRIRFEVTGAEKLELDSDGELVMHVPHGEMRLRKPTVYQKDAEGSAEIVSAYNLTAGNQVSFVLGSYDRSVPLVIDPLLTYSTYLGGNARDSLFNGMFVDADGNIYVTGGTNSLDFPTANALQPRHADNALQNAFVAKLSPDGSQLLYSTYLGGSNGDGRGIAVDSQGNAYVTGRANTPDFPITPNAFQRTFGGGPGDGWVAKLSPDGSTLLYCTYLGGSGTDNGNYIAVDDQGSAIIPGATNSTNFPTSNSGQSQIGGGFDGFVTKLSSDGSRLIYSTFLGGGSEDRANWISRDATGNVYVSGRTASINFPTVAAFQKTFNGGAFDAFVSKLDPDGRLLLSTYLGGSGDDTGGGTAVDWRGDIYFTGTTNSPNFPTRFAIQKAPGGGTCAMPARPCYDAFVAGLSADGSGLLFSTYLGGSEDDNCLEACGMVGLDGRGNLYIIGYTKSTDFPVVNALQSGLYPGICGNPAGPCGDGFVATLSADGQDLIFATYLGGSGDDIIWDTRVGLSNAIYITGTTSSIDYPMTKPLHTAYSGGVNDSFVNKLGIVSGINNDISANGVFYFAQAGGGGGFSTAIALTNPSKTNTVTGSISFAGSDGRPLEAVVANAVTPFVIEPQRTVIIRSLRQGALRSGYARVSSSGTVLVNATYLIPGDRPYLSVGPSSTGYVFQAPVSRSEPGVELGIALVNVSTTAAFVNLRLTDSRGNELASTRVRLAPNEQLSRFLSELIPDVPSRFEGALHIDSAGPVPFMLTPAQLAAVIVEFGPGRLDGIPLTVVR